jgi:nitroreductase
VNVSEAIAYRRSVRGFLDKPVDVHGESMVRLKAVMAGKIEARAKEAPQYHVYPPGLKQPYEGRRREVGEMLYGALGIPREDKAARMMWFMRNFQFFYAPVGLFISFDRQMEHPQWADGGALLNSIMLLLCEAGLDSCPQECWAVYPETVGGFLNLPDNRILWTGLSIGYKNPDDPANNLKANRAPSDEWLVMHG